MPSRSAALDKFPLARASARTTSRRSAASRASRRFSGSFSALEASSRKVARLDDLALGENHGALDHVFEFTDIAGPAMALDGSDRLVADAEPAALHVVCETSHQCMGQQGRIARPFAQRWNGDDDLGQPVKQVFAE